MDIEVFVECLRHSVEQFGLCCLVGDLFWNFIDFENSFDSEVICMALVNSFPKLFYSTNLYLQLLHYRMGTVRQTHLVYSKHV